MIIIPLLILFILYLILIYNIMMNLFDFKIINLLVKMYFMNL